MVALEDVVVLVDVGEMDVVLLRLFLFRFTGLFEKLVSLRLLHVLPELEAGVLEDAELPLGLL